MRKLAIIVATTLVGTGIASAPAFAQAVPQAPPEMDPGEAVLPNDPILEGAGVKVGEGTVIHPLVGLETGVVSNVFYEDQNPTAAGVLRLLVEIGTGSLPAERTTVGSTDDKNGTAETAANVSKGDFAYNANLYLTYDQYLSGDSDVTNQGGLGIGFLARGTVNPQRTFRFGFLEDFNRVIRSVDFETQSDNANRDLNQLVLQLQYFPEGRNLSGYLYFEDKFDLFEDENQRFADRTQNALGVRLNYQWLPQTRTFLNVSEGVYTGLGSDSRKVTSYPLLALLGIETALTLRTTVQARLGYTHGFYEAGPDFSALTGGIQLAYRYNPLGRVTLLYHYTHEDSINANFYGEHFIQAGIEHYFVPFLVFANGEIHLRDYQGLLIPGNMNSRDDFIAAANAGLRYGFRHNIAATVDYHFAAVQTDFRYMAAGIAPEDPSYVRHELLAGVRATY